MLLLNARESLLPPLDRVAVSISSWYRRLGLMLLVAIVPIALDRGASLHSLGAGATVIGLAVVYLLGFGIGGAIAGLMSPFAQTRWSMVVALTVALTPFAWLTCVLLLRLSLDDWLLWAATALGAITLGVIYAAVEWRER